MPSRSRTERAQHAHFIVSAATQEAELASRSRALRWYSYLPLSRPTRNSPPSKTRQRLDWRFLHGFRLSTPTATEITQTQWVTSLAEPQHRFEPRRRGAPASRLACGLLLSCLVRFYNGEPHAAPNRHINHHSLAPKRNGVHGSLFSHWRDRQSASSANQPS
jgi:hypothetical protein